MDSSGTHRLNQTEPNPTPFCKNELELKRTQTLTNSNFDELSNPGKNELEL